MKTRFYFPMIISLLVISVSLLTACGDSDNPLSDTTKPVIELKSPAEGGVLAIAVLFRLQNFLFHNSSLLHRVRKYFFVISKSYHFISFLSSPPQAKKGAAAQTLCSSSFLFIFL